MAIPSEYGLYLNKRTIKSYCYWQNIQTPQFPWAHCKIHSYIGVSIRNETVGGGGIRLFCVPAVPFLEERLVLDPRVTEGVNVGATTTCAKSALSKDNRGTPRRASRGYFSFKTPTPVANRLMYRGCLLSSLICVPLTSP